jgi:hypothetical protein
VVRALLFSLRLRNIQISKQKGGEKMKRILTILFLCIIAMMWAASANAAFITDTASTSGPTPVLDYVLSVDRFNPALGTLESAKFTLFGEVTSSLTVTVTGSPSQYTLVTWDKNDFGGHDRYYFGLSGPSSMTGNDSFAGQVVLRDRVDYGAPETFNAPTLNDARVFTFTGSALAPFVGAGVLDFLFSANSYDTVGTLGDNPSWSMSTAYRGKVDVEYDFTPVPIPGAVWLLASGLVGLVGLRKRFQK